MFSSNSPRFVNAFEIGLPEIPFLNFNFNLNGDSAESVSDSDDYSDSSLSDISNMITHQDDSSTHTDNSKDDLKTSTSDSSNNNDAFCL